MTNDQIALRIQWAEALESGKYNQGHGNLKSKYHDGTKYHCCLGVAMEEFGDDRWDENGDNCQLSDHACSLLGLDEAEKGFSLDQSDLINLNDEDRQPFVQIARYIRKNTPEPTEEKG